MNFGLATFKEITISPANGTKVSNKTTGQAKLFHCAPALIAGGRSDSAGKNIYCTNSREHNRTSPQLMRKDTVHKYL